MPKQYYNSYGQKIRNPGAYAKTGAPMFNKFYTKNGNTVNSPSKYSNAGGQLYAKTNINQKTDIYKLNLEKGKQYVGKTTDIDRRMNQHFSGNGSKVTQKFKPKTGQVIDSCPGFFGNQVEQYHTEELINEHGYENVRGGKYTNSKTLHNKNIINRPLSNSENKERINLRNKNSLTEEEHYRLEELKVRNRTANGKEYKAKEYTNSTTLKNNNKIIQDATEILEEHYHIDDVLNDDTEYDTDDLIDDILNNDIFCSIR